MSRYWLEPGEPFCGVNVVGAIGDPSGRLRIAMDVASKYVVDIGRNDLEFVFGTLDGEGKATELFRLSAFEAGFFVRRILEELL